MNKGITVNQLLEACKQARDRGYGNKHIQISSDDEGNSFHSLFYGFTDDSNGDLTYWVESGMMGYGINNVDEIIVLG